MARDKKYWQKRFGNPDRKPEPYYHHLDLRPIDDLDDEGFAYLMAGVKGVNMLDLNETGITNESIRLISGLEYVHELRAKGCGLLDNGCIPDLDKINSLRFLHVRSTGITIDGLLQLSSLTKLETLMFSAEDLASIKEKLLQLKLILPGCELVIDAKRYYFNATELFIHALKKQPYSYRLKIRNQPLDAAWSTWLTQPGDNHIEAEAQGPYSVNEIEWVEIDPVETKGKVKLVAEKEIDHAAAVIKLLEYLSFPFMVSGGIISAYLLNKEI